MKQLQASLRWLPLLIGLSAGVAVTVLAFQAVRHWEHAQRETHFTGVAADVVRQLRSRIHVSVEHVEMLARFVATQDALTPERFRGFALPATERHRSTRSLAWLARVPASQRAALEARMQRREPGFRITQRGPGGALVPAEQRPDYYPVLYFASARSAGRPVGFDVGSEPRRRRALAEARDTGEPTATERLSLLENEPGEYGLLVFVPVYTPGAVLDTVEARRRNLLGFAAGAFYVPELVHDALEAYTDLGPVMLYLFDRDAPPGERLLYAGDEPAPLEELRERPYYREAALRVAGRHWVIALAPRPVPMGTEGMLPDSVVVLGLGLLLTALLVGYLAFAQLQGARVRRLVYERTQALAHTAAELRHRERHIRAIHDTVLDGIVTIDRQGTIESVNPAAERIFGYDEGELTGRNVRELMPEPHRGRHGDYVEHYLRTGEARAIGTSREVTAVRRDGTPFPVELRLSELELDDRVRFTAVLQDITERKRAEAALRESEALLRAVVTGAPLILFAVDRNGVFTLSEGAGLGAIGRKPGEVVGRPIHEVYAEVPLILESTRRALAGEPVRVEVPVHEMVYETTYTPLRGPDDVIEGVIGVAYNITARKQAEAMKSEFVSTVSHELRTPLASILGYADLLLDEDVGPLSGDQRDFLRVISNNAVRLTELVSDLLDIEKLESGRIAMERKALDLFGVLLGVEHTFHVLAEAKGLKLSLDADEGLDLMGDENRLTQVFSNLVSNAVKYTREGTVRITAARTDGHIQVAVADSGIGMSPETQAQLFSRFFRAEDDYVRQAGGTGLGLAITAAIVQQHGGTVAVDSTPETGSTFTVRLPALPTAAPADTDRPAAVADGQGATCVLLGVGEGLRDALVQALAADGVRCVTVPAPEAALAALQAEPVPALLLADAAALAGNGEAPGADGELAALDAAARERDVPLVVLGDEADGPEAMRLGVAAVLPRAAQADTVRAFVLGLTGGAPSRALIVDDDPDFANVLQRMLGRRGLDSDIAPDGAAALEACARHRYAIAVLDYYLPGDSGVQVLRALRDAARPPARVVLISGETLDRTVEQEAHGLGCLRFLSKRLGVTDIARIVHEYLAPNGG